MITYMNKNYELPVCKYRGGWKDIKYPCLVSLKLDGELTYVIKKGSKVLSVNKPKYGRHREDYPALNALKEVPGDAIYLGELHWSEGRTKEDFYGLLRNKTNNLLRLTLWGVLQFKQMTNIPVEDAYKILDSVAKKIDSMYLSVVPHGWVYNEHELEKWIEKYIDRGWEGLVVYNKGAVWRNGQTRNIIKIKKREREVVTKNKNGKCGNLKLKNYGVWL